MSMEFTLAEFKEKAEQIPQLTFKKSNSGYYFWQATGNNKEVREYLIKTLIEKLNITDCYKLPTKPEEGNKWVKKEDIDNIINKIKNAESYDEIKTIKDDIYIDEITIKQENDITKGIQINYGYSFHKAEGHKIITDMLKNTDGIHINKITSNGRVIFVKTDTIDQKELCKHKCKTNMAISNIDEIFGI